MKKISTPKGKLPIYYGWNALSEFAGELGITMDQVIAIDMRQLPPSELSRFILIGFQEGARKSEEECKVSTITDVGDMIDVLGFDLINQALEAFTEMSFVSAGEEEEEEGKKK